MGMPGWHVVSDFIKVLSKEGRLVRLYRGQPNAEWQLIPSIFRSNTNGIRNDSALYKWKQLASRFASPLPIDNIEWLVLAQHYGLATPLLDWTTSPLVALYFACDDETQSHAPGAVWTIDRTHFQDAHNTLTIHAFGADRDKPFLINAVGRNPRSTAQDSFMSLHTDSDYETLPTEKIFEVEPSQKQDTILTLGKLGLTAERLHFDITKLVARIKEDL
ncbi:MAG TPA: FRG domain-containing protein [Croceibacterium sp.]|nr:FRG domain-containing protein [Croceibacterium sp.]